MALAGIWTPAAEFAFHIEYHCTTDPYGIFYPQFISCVKQNVLFFYEFEIKFRNERNKGSTVFNFDLNKKKEKRKFTLLLTCLR